MNTEWEESMNESFCQYEFKIAWEKSVWLDMKHLGVWGTNNAIK